jgi:hypothetical protein
VPTIHNAKAKPLPHDALRGSLLSWGILAGAFAFFAGASWRTWPDILIDFGHELYVPWRLSLGDRLYRDIAFTMGPLSQHFNSLLFRLFGVSLTTLIVANVAILAVILAMLVWIFRRLGSRGSATFIGLFFLAVFSFAQYRLVGNYNYVCPYRHEVTHGLALGLANLICLVRLSETRQKRWLAACGLFLGLIALTKSEMLLPAVMTAMTAIWAVIWWGCRDNKVDGSGTRQDPAADFRLAARQTILWMAVSGIAAIVPIGIAWLGLTYSLGWKLAAKAIFINYKLALDPDLTARSRFYRALSGLDSPSENALGMFLSALTVVAVATAAVALSVLAGKAFGRATRTISWMVAVGITAALIALRMVTQNQWSLIPAALPLLLSVIVVVTLRRCRQIGFMQPAYLQLLVAVYAVGLLPKILLKVDWGHYGFVLAMPGTLLVVHLAIRSIPEWLEQRFGSGNTFRALAIGAMSACAIYQVAIWERIDRMKTLTIGTGGDRFYADPQHDDRSLPTLRTLEYLQRVMRNGETLVVFPEGATLNYLLRKRNPTPFLMYNPWEFDAQGGEQGITETLIASSPDYVVLVTQDLAVHGRGEFGNPHFGGQMLAFIEDQYEIAARHVSSAASGDQPTFQSTVFKRRRSRS